MKKLTDNEVKKTSKLLVDMRYAYALEKIIENQEIYMLEESDGSYAISKIDEITLISMWPAEEYAELDKSGVWSSFKPKKISLKYLEPILDFIEDNDWKIDMFPVGGKTGHVLTVSEFIDDLNRYSKELLK